MKFFGNRLGLEANFYSNKIVDQILWLSVPSTVGASSMLTNIGELKNVGIEASIYGSPVQTKDFKWDIRSNFSKNRNEVVSLMKGVDRLTHANIDAGAALIVSEPGQPMGDILCYLPKKDASGTLIVDPTDGLYQINFDKMEKVGNVTPDIVGGIGNYLEYKNFFIDFTIDFNLGSEVMSIARQYMKGAGMFEETLKYRDAANGGLAYYINDAGKKVLATNAPAGAKIYNDGLILPGNKPDGTKNDVIVDAPNFYLNTYTWGANPAWGIPYSRYDDAVVKNDYHGIFVNGPEWKRSGRWNKNCLQFNGRNSYVAIPGSSSIDFDPAKDDFTIETWVNLDNLNGVAQTFFSKCEWYSISQYDAYLASNRFEVDVGSGTAAWLSPKPEANKWFNLVLTSEAGKFQLYVNGQAMTDKSTDGTNPSSVDRTSYPFILGAASISGNIRNYFFQGRMDELTVFKRVLTPGEIKGFYEMGQP